MTVRNFVSTAPDTTLNGAIDNVQTGITVASSSGYPTAPFTAAIQPDSGQEELVEVTNVAGASWTVTRGIDGTSALAHSTGVTVRHVASARDFNEANAHINASTNVHGTGASNAVVGTGTAQTLTNKTLTSPTINSPSVSGGTFSGSPNFSGTPTIGDLTNVQHDHSAANKGGVSLSGVTLAGTVAGTPTVSGAWVFTGDPRFEGATAADLAARYRVNADSNNRLQILADGKHNWGPGNATPDTTLYRSATDTLKTDDSFVVGTNLSVTGTSALTGDVTMGGALAVNAGATVQGGKTVRHTRIPADVSTKTSDTAFGTGETNILSSGTVTGDGATRVKVTVSWGALATQAGGNSQISLRIYRDTTQLHSARWWVQNGSGDDLGTSIMVTDVPPSGAHTYSFKAIRLQGDTGTQILAAATSPLTLLVEQVD